MIASIENSANGQLRLTWNSVANAASYNIYYATAPGVTTASLKIAGVLSSPYLHSALTNGTIYYYRISAVQGTYESPLSVEMSNTAAAQFTFIDTFVDLSKWKNVYLSSMCGATLCTNGDWFLTGEANNRIHTTAAAITTKYTASTEYALNSIATFDVSGWTNCSLNANVAYETEAGFDFFYIEIFDASTNNVKFLWTVSGALVGPSAYPAMTLYAWPFTVASLTAAAINPAQMKIRFLMISDATIFFQGILLDDVSLVCN